MNSESIYVFVTVHLRVSRDTWTQRSAISQMMKWRNVLPTVTGSFETKVVDFYLCPSISGADAITRE